MSFSPTSSLLFFQSITEPTYGFNCVAGLAKLLSQATDVRVHCSRVNHTVIAPDVFEQAITVLQATTALHEGTQKFELDSGEVDLLAIHRNFIPRRING